ncbi:MAG: ATP-binding cassette domain-containing protein [Chromatiaceae bacterium]|jgi:putative ABC transport system ATP-binding protein
MANNTARISTTQLSKQITMPDGKVLDILSAIDMRVNAGEAVAILGPSGSGKSTLLGLLAGLDTPTHGEVVLLGETLSQLDEDQRAALRAGRVGFVFQSFQLLPGMTALENVALPLQLSGRSNARSAAATLLEEVGLGERLTHLPRQLSGGEQQRVALARAFAGDPAVLFADEPTGNLDAASGERITELMFRLRDRAGSTLLLVTHDLQLARRCDRVLRLNAGRLLQEAA